MNRWPFLLLCLIATATFAGPLDGLGNFFKGENNVPSAQQPTSENSPPRNLNVVSASAGAKRVALVIGNADYRSSPLKNPVNDARAMADKLKNLGFEVVQRENLTQKQIGGTLREFRSKLTPGAEALFFYAGHGLQVKGVNYLPAVDADITAEEDVPTQSIDVNKVLEVMEENKTRLNLVFLDACRNNPFNRGFRNAGGGLAKIIAPSGTKISFATRPGSVAADGEGDNGLYTEHLLRAMSEQGVPIEQSLKSIYAGVKKASKGKQEPWSEGEIEGDFYFIQTVNIIINPPPANAARIDTPPAPTGGSLDLEDLKKQDASRKQWAKWQAGMKAAYEEISGFDGDAELKAAAWERFLSIYAQKNPYSAEDEQLRGHAKQKRDQAQGDAGRQKEALERQRREAEAATLRAEEERQRQQAAAEAQRREQEAREAAAELRPGKVFKDCDDCPEMVVVPAGSFDMGNNYVDSAKPVHSVRISQPFAVGKFAVTVGQYLACVNDGGCSEPVWREKGNQKHYQTGNDNKYGFYREAFPEGNYPIVGVSWDNAKQYVKWLSHKTGKKYTLPSEAEWEYACRAGGNPTYCGSDSSDDGRDGTIIPRRIGQRKSNDFGLHDMTGNVSEWVEDCWHINYVKSPIDGSAWVSNNCSNRVARGGFSADEWYIGRKLVQFSVSASTDRLMQSDKERDSMTGFRVTRKMSSN